MNVLIFLRTLSQSFNGALLDTAVRELEAAGHTVKAHQRFCTRMGFIISVSDRHNFKTVKDPDYLKLQVEETHATEYDGFAPGDPN